MTEPVPTTELLVISNPGINPSNRNAGFPNLAKREPFYLDTVASVTATCEEELKTAGINICVVPRYPGARGEVPSNILGSLSMWLFERHWYYWSANGPGLPVEVAERLHVTHGTVVRVAGHCGCPSPREWYKGFGIGDYHIDTPDGLRALADTLRSVYDANKDPEATPRTR